MLKRQGVHLRPLPKRRCPEGRQTSAAERQLAASVTAWRVETIVELQRSYETLQRWLLTEVSNPVNTSAAVQLGGKSQHGTKEALFQGIAWHNCTFSVQDCVYEARSATFC